MVLMKRMLPLLWEGGVCTILLLMLGGWLLGPVLIGIRQFGSFIVSSLLLLSVLNDDGMSGTILHPVVWSAAAKPKRRKVEQGGGNFAWLPGPVHLWISDWYQLPIACIGEVDNAAWPFSVGLLLKFVHFLGSLHWPRGAGDLGVGGVSNLELLILYEKWAGERKVIKGAVPFARRVGVQFQCRLFRLVQALILGALVAFLVVGCFGFCLVALVQINAGFDIRALKSVGMGLLLGPGKRRIPSF